MTSPLTTFNSTPISPRARAWLAELGDFSDSDDGASSFSGSFDSSLFGELDEDSISSNGHGAGSDGVSDREIEIELLRIEVEQANRVSRSPLHVFDSY